MGVVTDLAISTKKRSEQKRIEMVINFSLGRDEDYGAARQGVMEEEE